MINLNSKRTATGHTHTHAPPHAADSSPPRVPIHPQQQQHMMRSPLSPASATRKKGMTMEEKSGAGDSGGSSSSGGGSVNKRARVDAQGAARSSASPPQWTPSILATLSAESAAAAAAAAGNPSAVHPSHPHHLGTPPVSMLTGAAIHSPRRAIVCASLEHAALCSSLLTQSSIHPAILQSLSVRLQALNDHDAEIVLARLTSLAKHLEQQTQVQKAARAAQIKYVQAQTLHSPQQPQTTQRHQHPHAGSPPHSIPASGLPPPSPIPALSSSSSVNTDSTSNTTSPTISPAVGAMSPPQHASSSPQHFVLQHQQQAKTTLPSMPRTPPQNSLAGKHPPLHPQTPGSGSNNGQHHPNEKHPTQMSPYAQMLLHSNRQLQLQQQHQQLQHHPPQQPPLHPPPTSQAQVHSFSALPLHTSMAPSTTSTSSAGSSAHSPSLPQLDSSVAPPLARSHSEDSDIPLGLMLLIEALPGSNVGPLTAAGDLANTSSPKVAQRALKQSAVQAQQATAAAGTPGGNNASSDAGGLQQLNQQAAPPPPALASATSASAASSSSQSALPLPPPTALQRSTSA